MSFSVVNRAEVKSDILAAVDYYKKINPKLAKQLLFRIREAKTSISQTPYVFQIKYKGVRTILLNSSHITFIIW